MKKLISNYAEFNLWANYRIADWLQSVDESVLQTEVLSSFTSIDFTLQHMLRTERFWLAFIMDENVQNFDWSVKKQSSATTLQQLLDKSQELKDVFCAYNETGLEKVLQLNMPWAKNALPRYEYILHVINHSTYHRGQIVTIARGLGIENGIPGTDYNIFNCK